MRLPSTSGSRSKLLLPLFGCFPVAWLAMLFAQAVSPGMSLSEMIDALTVAFSNPFTLISVSYTHLRAHET